MNGTILPKLCGETYYSQKRDFLSNQHAYNLQPQCPYYFVTWLDGLVLFMIIAFGAIAKCFWPLFFVLITQ